MNEVVLIIFYVAILLYTVIIHEVSHGIVAMWLGDNTAKYAGRLNLNPVKHIDLVGSVIVPLFMIITVGFAFGWAKPVPYNPYNLKNQKWGPAMVALSGPGSNVAIAIIATIFAKLMTLTLSVKQDILYNLWTPSHGLNIQWEGLATSVSGSFGNIFFAILVMVIIWNVFLAFFNLIPIPPLDGSKLLFAVFPIRMETMMMLEQFGFIILLAFIVFFSGPLGVFLNLMLNLFLGITL